MTGAKSSIIRYLPDTITVLEDRDFSHADYVYWIYGPGPSWLNFLPKLYNSHSRILIHWVGSDVSFLSDKLSSSSLRAKIYYRLWLKATNINADQHRVHHFSVSEWLQDELLALGIKSTVLPISALNDRIIEQSTDNTDRKYDFVSYIPYNGFDFYGGNEIVKLAKLLPDKLFAVFNSDKESINAITLNVYPSNVTIFSLVEHSIVQEIFRNSKCLLRLTKHDGLSRSVLEALCAKMQVIWTCDYPYSVKINLDNFEDIYNKARNIADAWVLNEAGHDYIKANFSQTAMQAMYDSRLNSLLKKR